MAESCYNTKMSLGGFHHIDLNVSNLAASRHVYDTVLTFLGYAMVRDEPDSCEWDLYRGANGMNGASLGIKLASPEDTNYSHRRYAPGLHHFAWRAESKKQVDQLYELLQSRNIKILDPPAQYPEYSGDYYAVFFEDPDGIKLELVHSPGWI